MSEAKDNITDPLVDRAVRLFEFLGQVQRVKARPVRLVDTYEREGQVIWFHHLPTHPAIKTAPGGLTSGAPLLVVDRVPRLQPPAPPTDLQGWLEGALDQSDVAPRLRDSRVVGPENAEAHDGAASDVVLLDERPEVRAAYDRWLASWQAWADQDLADQPARDLYGELFSTYIAETSHPEELELVLGLGCLSWHPESHDPVSRHLLTSAVTVHFDDASGQLLVGQVESPDTAAVETEMLDPALIRTPQRVQDVRDDARDLAAHLLDRDEVEPLLRRLVNSLHPDATYIADDLPPGVTGRPQAAFAPALILRKRSQQGLIQIFDKIVAELREAAAVPEGVRSLIDPDHTPDPGKVWTSNDGALVQVDDEPFLPLPVNEQQLKIIRKVDTAAQVLVQGPPGTGKTHTAAALISHLLAQGKRVLLTAQTDRALKEVREKLPEEIRPLSVAVVGASRDDMSDLKVAVERIGQHAAEYEQDAAEHQIGAALNEIDRLRRHRAQLYRDVVEAREREVRRHERGEYRGTLAAIAQQHAALADQYGWIRPLASPGADDPPPVTSEEAALWCQGLLDPQLRGDADEARQDLPDPTALPGPEVFAGLVTEEASAANAAASTKALQQHRAFTAIAQLDDDVRRQIQQGMHELAGEADALAVRDELWMSAALAAIASGKAGSWHDRRSQVDELIKASRPLVQELGPLADVRVTAADPAPLVPLAEAVLGYLDGGGKFKTELNGKPKIGAFASRVIRQSADLFDHVTVDGVPPTTTKALQAFLNWVNATRCLDALDRAWPADVTIPAEDTLRERLSWHVTEISLLDRLLALAGALEAEEARLAEIGVPTPDWTDLHDIHTFAQLVDAAAAIDAHTRAEEPLAELADLLAQGTRWPDAAPVLSSLHTAVLDRDPVAHLVAHERLLHLLATRERLEELDDISDRLLSAAPALHRTVTDTPDATAWAERLSELEAAWQWAATAAWITRQEQVDINAVQQELQFTEDRIRKQVSQLAATRAWSHAVAPDRLTGQARADLQQYAGLVRRLGKGTGKYANQRRRDIRQAMDRSRPAVPVWIMPIYRIAEQLRISQDMFDVVIVDEASQAGLEATFLQYLAPKIVVIGDDRQVSPSAVGIDLQRLRDLALQYLHDNRHRATWEDPKRSLFDEAVMRFGGRITLVEHRRSVPEIIGFSNRIAYEPDGIRLIPVRQYGADRLEPIKMVFLPDGFTRGDSNKINPAEVDAIVDQILKCAADPAYDGLTFGVISLQGTAQAKTIEKRLLESDLPPEEWTARALRCGDSADFQGSERDVMFLSMVAAPEPGKRLGAATQEMYVQRYNVAASRAENQMWVYHSLSLDDIANPNDMRFKLLDYCYGVVNRTTAGVDGACLGPVPEDTPVEPFDSLFEQRVCNRLTDHGLMVIPQYPVEGRRIDLVVVGAKAKLAIECDGDTWHGPDQYEQDLARQRDLEGCGWTFFRIRESAFYVDSAAALSQLWDLLEHLEIHASGWGSTASLPARREGLGPPPAASLTGLVPAAAVVNDGEADGAAVASSPERGPSSAEVAADEDEEESPPASGSTPLRAPEAPQTLPEKTPTVAATRTHADLDAYTPFAGSLTPALEARRDDLIEGIRAVVAAEGPVLGSRLHQAYVRACGGQRVGKQIAKALNSAVSLAVRRGVLIEDAPLGEAGVRPKTFRLPEQPQVLLRDPGPRDFDQIPPRELAEVLEQEARVLGWNDVDRLYHAVLTRYRLKRLTASVRQRLDSVRPLAT